MQRQLACVASRNRKLLQSQQCLLTKLVPSVRVKMRITWSLARLLGPTPQWGLEFRVISNSFQQKA